MNARDFERGKIYRDQPREYRNQVSADDFRQAKMMQLMPKIAPDKVKIGGQTHEDFFRDSVDLEDYNYDRGIYANIQDGMSGTDDEATGYNYEKYYEDKMTAAATGSYLRNDDAAKSLYEQGFARDNIIQSAGRQGLSVEDSNLGKMQNYLEDSEGDYFKADKGDDDKKDSNKPLAQGPVKYSPQYASSRAYSDAFDDYLMSGGETALKFGTPSEQDAVNLSFRTNYSDNLKNYLKPNPVSQLGQGLPVNMFPGLASAMSKMINKRSS